MKKEEYLNRLEMALNGLSKDFVQEILEDYDTHFQDGLESGRNEEEICQELGDITELVNEFRDIARDGVKMEVIPPQPEVKQTTEEGSEEEKETTLKRVCFSATMTDVTVYPSKDGELHVYLKGSSNTNITIEERIDGDCYYGKVVRRKNRSDFLQLFTGFSADVVIELPQNVEYLEVKGMSGDIEAERLHLNGLILKTFSGDVELHHSTADKLKLSTKSGDVETDHIVCSVASLESISGDVDADHIALKYGDFHSTSGDVRLNLDCGGKAYIVDAKTMSGDLRIRGDISIQEMTDRKLNLEDCIQIRAHSVSGDVKVTG